MYYFSGIVVGGIDFFPKFQFFYLGCFRRKRQGIVIALASSSVEAGSAAVACENFDIF